MGMLEEQIIKDGLPDDRWEALTVIVSRFEETPKPKNIAASGETEYVKMCSDLIALLTVFSEVHAMGLGFSELGGDEAPENVVESAEKSIKSIRSMLTKRAFHDQFQRRQAELRTLFPTAVVYEFTRDDLAEVQRYINQIRDILNASGEVEEPHRRRMLKKLEELQKEFSKRMSSLDSVFGKILQVFGATKLLGEERAEAASDALMMLAQFVWQRKADAEGLPPAARLPLRERKPRLGDGSSADSRPAE